MTEKGRRVRSALVHGMSFCFAFFFCPPLCVCLLLSFEPPKVSPIDVRGAPHERIVEPTGPTFLIGTCVDQRDPVGGEPLLHVCVCINACVCVCVNVRTEGREAGSHADEETAGEQADGVRVAV